MTDITFDKSRILFEKASKVIPGGVNSPVRYFQPYPFLLNLPTQVGYLPMMVMY